MVLWWTASAYGAVIANDGDGFTVQHDVLVDLPAVAAWKRALQIGDWWSGDHTYSGEAARLSLQATPGGCWCERLSGGGFVEHMRVVVGMRGELLRMTGALGPLQELGASGALTWTFTPEAGGTRVAWTYAVRGASGETFASPVDDVLGDAISRYAAAAGGAAPSRN